MPEPEQTVEKYSVHDLVTHDKYGLGTVTGADDPGSVLIDFDMVKLRITLPCAKLFKL